MNVAIIGAGLAGLACAYELERNGIFPQIFERSSLIGENIELPAIQLRMFNIPISDPYHYMKKNHHLDLTPHYRLNELIMKSPNKTTTVKGNLGWVFRRGSFSDSMTNQIRRLLTSPIHLNTDIYYRDIKNKFDHVVIASGSLSEAEDMGILTTKYSACSRMATLTGKFKTDSIKVWLNTEYAKASYAYFVPDTQEQAKLVLLVNGINPYQVDSFWNNFLMMENISYTINKTLDIPHKIGRVSPVQIGNLYFCGLAGGFMDDFIGFGTINCVISGLLAGRSIARKLDYNKAMKPFLKKMAELHEYRIAMNGLKNEDFDNILTLLDMPVYKTMIYKNPLFKVSQGSPGAKLYNFIKTHFL